MGIHSPYTKKCRHAEHRAKYYLRISIRYYLTLCLYLASSTALSHYASQAPNQNNAHSLNISSGAIAIERKDLLFSRYSASGNTLQLSSPRGDELQVFALTALEADSLEKAINIHQKHKTHYGATLDVNIAEPINLEFGYIGERKNILNRAIDKNTNLSDTSSWNMSIKSVWLNKSLRTHWEYAESSGTLRQPDSTEIKTGNALHARLQLSSDGDLGRGWLDFWTSNVVYRRVNPNYYTPGNHKLATGKEFTQVAFESGLNNIDMRLSWQEEQEIEPVNLLQLTPVTERTSLQFKYDLSRSTLPSPLLHLLDTPTLSARYIRREKTDNKKLLNLYGQAKQQLAYESGVNLAFGIDQWHWSLDYQVLEKRAQTLTANETWHNDLSIKKHLQRRSQLQLSWVPSSHIALKLKAQKQYQNEVYSSNDKHHHLYRVEASVDMIPDVISLKMKYDYKAEEKNQTRQTNHTSHKGNAKLSWHSVDEYGHRPSVDIYLKSSFDYQQSSTKSLPSKQWSAYLGVELYWPHSL
ncbi:hypothetical protein [Aurantivibrio plasticivorans]